MGGQNGRSPAPLSSRTRGWLALLAVGGLLGLAALAASLSAPAVNRLPPPSADQTFEFGTGLPSRSADQPTEAPPRGRQTIDIPAWVADLALALCVAATLGIVLFMTWALIRDTFSTRRRALPVDGDAGQSLRSRTDEVVAALDEGLADLSDADRDPRRAVIACWLRLEQAAAAAGTPRQVVDTSTDHVLRLLNEHRVDRRVLGRFAEIYREARYATHTVDDRMRAEAQSALRQLRAELVAGAVADAAATSAAGAAGAGVAGAAGSREPS